MTKIKKLNIAIIAFLLAITCGLMYCLTTYQKSNYSTTSVTRTIEVGSNDIDYQSVFDGFEDAVLTSEDGITTFEGIKTFNLADFDEIDLVSDSDALEQSELKIKYSYNYDYEANIITLSAKLLDENGVEIIDEMVGVPFVNDDGELDAVFDCDGEYILLSELQDAGMIENCGWFRNLCKKVVNTVKKVTSTVIGTVGAIATVAVPAVIGVVCAVAAAPVVATVAVGALVGVGIAAGTAAISTYQQDGKVDWGAVGICAGVGGAVGALASGVAYGVTNAIMSKAAISNAISNVEPNRINHIMQQKHGWDRLGGSWDSASKAIEYTLNHGTSATYGTAQEITTAVFNGEKVQVVTKVIDGVRRIVDAWIVF